MIKSNLQKFESGSGLLVKLRSSSYQKVYVMKNDQLVGYSNHFYLYSAKQLIKVHKTLAGLFWHSCEEAWMSVGHMGWTGDYPQKLYWSHLQTTFQVWASARLDLFYFACSLIGKFCNRDVFRAGRQGGHLQLMYVRGKAYLEMGEVKLKSAN